MPKYTESKHSKVDNVSRISSAWWDEKANKRHQSVRALLEVMRQEQATRDFENLLYYTMYLGRHVSSLDGDGYAHREALGSYLRINVAHTTAAAANAKVAKNKVRVLFLTEDGQWSQQARGKRMTKLINGTFYDSGFYEAQTLAQLMSTTWDLGAVYLYAKGKKVACEAVPGTELRVDAWDARYGKPSMLFWDKTVPRAQVLAEYGGNEKMRTMILGAKRSERGTMSAGKYIADCIDVTRAWHLRSNEDADDGCYTVALENCTLEHEAYDRDYFPFIFHRWEPCLLGFYGHSICAQLLGIQDNTNKVAQDIQDHCDLSTGFVAIPEGADVSAGAWTNEVWKKITYSGQQPPTMVSPPAFQREKLDWLQWLVSRAPQEVGLSELSVTSRKPAGLNSGKALREYNDIESERFQMVQQRWEQSFVDASLIIADLYEDIYQEHDDFNVKTTGHKLVESISWKAARLDRENFKVRPVPTSFLPTTPAAKLETIQEMLTAGMLSHDEAMVLLDYPDLDRVNTLRNAGRLNLERRIEDMLDPDRPKKVVPESFWNLQLALQLGTSAYNDAEQAGAPEKNLEILRTFISQVQQKIEEQEAQAAAKAAAAAPPPGAMPMPPPPAQPQPGAPALPM